MNQKIKKIALALLFIIICLGIGYLGNQFSGNSAKDVYADFAKPSFFPPDDVFAPVWTFLYILMGISVSIIWAKRRKDNVDSQLGWFFLQLFVNLLWPIIFFGLKNYLLALVLIIFLFVLIVQTARSFEKISKPAAYLLIPYMLWTGFATILNYTIWLLYR